MYHGTRRGPSTPDLTSQTYLPVVGRKNKPQSAGRTLRTLIRPVSKKQDVLHIEYEGNTAYNFDHSEVAAIATVNTQGLNWMKIAHQDNLEILLDLHASPKSTIRTSRLEPINTRWSSFRKLCVFWDEQLVLSWVMQQDRHGKKSGPPKKFECFMIASWVFHYKAVGACPGYILIMHPQA